VTMPLEVIMAVLDEFNVEDFVDENFNGIAAHKIITSLEWHNFRIVPLGRERDAGAVGDAGTP
jgi:hypothetical protein